MITCPFPPHIFSTTSLFVVIITPTPFKNDKIDFIIAIQTYTYNRTIIFCWHLTNNPIG